ncbi:NACHT, LRR and PYD domains-containing protein 1 [Rousettus aegyptiacus]|uniref:NACHT, LRR and PYD domains-containing protein 1 n=1 Tax=Rousettus aegyptiacus TaxID=9407 RepID=UPI00168D2182|nr:NACHT, LRR and PYD domains-containing protein 1 [Rousettus aegyptiacus]
MLGMCFKEEFLTQVIAHFQGRRLYVQNDMKLLMLTFYFKSRCCMKRLQLNESGQHRQAQRPHTVVLSSWVPFTDACWQVFFSILKVTGSLQELDLSRNFVSCSTIQSLREDLKCPHCHLDTLR